MRALVKRLAATGLTVLLSSHDMGEVEEICDNVTIMRTGTVVYHGGLAELRKQAPEQGHRIRTADNVRALALAGERVRVEPAADGALVVYGSQQEVDACVMRIVTAGIPLRGLELTEAPLESLFFMLTESAPGGVPRELEPTATGALR
jgi:ABC-2 type transport system ATP-binding protein